MKMLTRQYPQHALKALASVNSRPANDGVTERISVVGGGVKKYRADEA